MNQHEEPQQEEEVQLPTYLPDEVRDRAQHFFGCYAELHVIAKEMIAVHELDLDDATVQDIVTSFIIQEAKEEAARAQEEKAKRQPSLYDGDRAILEAIRLSKECEYLDEEQYALYVGAWDVFKTGKLDIKDMVQKTLTARTLTKRAFAILMGIKNELGGKRDDWKNAPDELLVEYWALMVAKGDWTEEVSA